MIKTFLGVLKHSVSPVPVAWSGSNLPMSLQAPGEGETQSYRCIYVMGVNTL